MKAINSRIERQGRVLSAFVVAGCVAGVGGIGWWVLGDLFPARDKVIVSKIDVEGLYEDPPRREFVDELICDSGAIDQLTNSGETPNEPRLMDSEQIDRADFELEAEPEESFMEASGDPNFLSDSPFDESNLNDVIGIGGGPGGMFGGRFGRHSGGSGSEVSLSDNVKSVPRSEPPAKWANEEYQDYPAEGFQLVTEHPLSTFSIDVDRASYTNARRMLDLGFLPLPASIRAEEFINHFAYDYPRPEGEDPLALAVEIATCPWRPENRLVRVTLASRELDDELRQARNLVFLIDVSGSMTAANKLPLFKRGLRMLVGELDERDSISIVAYAAGARVVLSPTPGNQKDSILTALDGLSAGGSTNGAGGIQLAYECASQNFIRSGVNRVLLGTDGDFNVGLQSRSELVKLIEQQRESGVFLTVLGFGEGNLKDATLEQIANKGNGHYLYVGSLSEARRVFVKDVGANLVTVAKDVKLQVEFNPAEVQSYRLVGYANRKLKAREFNDDGVDAGEVGAGHGVTAFYEVVPARFDALVGVDPLRYQRPLLEPTARSASGEFLTVKLRYKLPDEDVSRRREHIAVDPGPDRETSSPDFRFGAAVALFAELLAETSHVSDRNFDDVLILLDEVLAVDPTAQRTDFFDLVRRAQEINTN